MSRRGYVKMSELRSAFLMHGRALCSVYHAHELTMRAMYEAPYQILDENVYPYVTRGKSGGAAPHITCVRMDDQRPSCIIFFDANMRRGSRSCPVPGSETTVRRLMDMASLQLPSIIP